MYVLGISAYYHDSAACLIYNDEIIAAAHEERFTRKKQDSGFPKNAVIYCLSEAGIDLKDLEAVVYYEKPFLKFERLLESFYHFAPFGLQVFVSSVPVWLREKLFIKDELYQNLKSIGSFDKRDLKIRFSEHHLSHAASAYYPSGFESSAILTIDGMGEWASASIAVGESEKIDILKELHYPNSVGLLYSSFTYFLGFMVNSGEYKLMGLAPYGNNGSGKVDSYKNLIKETLVDICDDGSIKLNMDYFSFATGLRMIKTNKWEKLFGIKKKNPETTFAQEHCDLALAIQQVTEEIVIKMAYEAKRLTGKSNLCIAGGVGLNCVANSAILNEKIFEKIFIQPASGDAGGSLGAALAYVHLHLKIPHRAQASDKMKGSFLGPQFSDKDVLKIARRYNAKYHHFNNAEDIYDFTANQIILGKVVGWFRGRMEFGPRALGNRSILADARNAEMQKKLNLKIKYREGFRPFAPSVIAENTKDFFDITTHSPYMLLTAPVNKDLQIRLPDNYNQLDIMSKLYFQRSNVPAITHCDYSARLQTVHKDTNPDYYRLIERFKELTGTALIINTSFNVRGEPIVCTPNDAFRCFMRTEMDVLVMQNFIFIKDEQDIRSESFNEKFKPD
jgi:carbamoyltransferase